MCISQFKPANQLGLSSQFDNIKFWKVKTAFRTKFPFLLPAVMMALKSCRPYCSDLFRSGAFNCCFLPVSPNFTWEGRTHSRSPHAKDLVSRQKDFLQLRLCPHILCGLQLGSKRIARPTTHPLPVYCHLRPPDTDTGIITPSLFRPPISFVRRSSYANRGW